MLKYIYKRFLNNFRTLVKMMKVNPEYEQSMCRTGKVIMCVLKKKDLT